MTKAHLGFLTFILCTGILCGEEEPGFVPLFNGKNFDGWVIMGREAGWRIEDGVIRSDGAMGGRGIRTDKQYANFTLRLEWMISEAGNSGVFIRIGGDAARTGGFEVQILAPWTPRRDDLHCTGSIYGHVAVKPRPDETPGKWRSFEITCDRKNITVKSDGVVCCQANMDEVPSLKGKALKGYVGFQDSHAAKGKWVKFRNIRIRDFDQDPEYVMAGLRSEDERIRQQAFEAAGTLGAKLMVPLFEFLQSDDPAMVHASRQALFAAVGVASAPGHEQDRSAAVAVLVKHLQPAHPPRVRKYAARLLRIAGRDDAVPALAGALKDEVAHEGARCALQQIPGAQATKVLLDAAKTCAPAQRPGILLALGARRDPAATEILTTFASEGDVETRIAAIQALGQIGGTKAVPTLENIAKQGPTNLKVAACEAILAIADRNLQEDRASALKLYGFVFDASPDALRKGAALAGLGKAGDPEILKKVAAALSDKALRPIALDVLAHQAGNEAERIILDEMKSATDAEKVMLLKALYDRKSAQALAQLLAAARGDDGAAKAIAIGLLGMKPDPSHEELLLAAIASADSRVKTAAVQAYLLLADAYRTKGDTRKALEMYKRVVDAAGLDPNGQHALAAITLLDAGSAVQLIADKVESGRWKKWDEVRGYIAVGDALAVAGKKKEAADMYSRIDLEGLSERQLESLREEMQRRGMTAKVAEQAGFITNWWIIGTFLSPDNSAYGKKFFPEDEVALDKEYEVEERMVRWRPYHETKSAEGTVELLSIFPRARFVACYAYAEVNSDKERDVVFKIGTDDGYELWLNGKRLSGKQSGRKLTVDEDVVAAKLVSGTNRILLKVLNQGSRWAYCVRITDPQGNPLPLPQKPAKE